ncbi:MAG: transposase [Pseudomonadota bacterium]
MAKKRILQGFKSVNGKIGALSSHSSLCALAPVIYAKEMFEPIHQDVQIPQKTLIYRPTDKLVFVTLGIMSGSETVYDINQTLRVDQALLRAFGYEQCADQSVIQETLNAATADNVTQLEFALQRIWEQNNLTVPLLESASSKQKVVTIDIDLSGQPASKNAEHSTKGYFAGRKNCYGRQLARVLLPETQEIVTESLYPGNTLSCSVFKETVTKMEQILPLENQTQPSIRLRLDAGFGTDENINFALWRGYHILAKIYSGKRATKLAKSVCEWVDVPSKADNTPRQAGWVTTPHRYCRKTKQVAIRTPKQDGRYTSHVLVTTDMSASLSTIVTDYDARSGVPESNFCQDSQGLNNRKRRKRSFVAQQMLTLLGQLAHNLIRWIQSWMIDAVEQAEENNVTGDVPSDAQEAALVVKTLKERGMKRFVRQILALSGKVIIKGKRVLRIILNPLYPLIKRIRSALEALLKPYGITVSLGKT